MMNCEESQSAFSPYLDGELELDPKAALDAHLGACPVCRQRLEEMRSMLRGLSLVERPAAPPGLASSISRSLAAERAALRGRATLPAGARIARWLEPHLMPYAVGAFYSMLLFVAVFGALRQQFQVLRNLAEAQRLEAGLPYSFTWIDGPAGGYDVTRPLSPETFAAMRSPHSAQSPSLNPRGALARMAWSPSGGARDDDGMVVVADVYGNGRASLAAVVEPPRDPRMLDDLEVAFRKNPAFVPAALDRRPQTMRVVFVLQKMNVPDSSY